LGALSAFQGCVLLTKNVIDAALLRSLKLAAARWDIPMPPTDGDMAKFDVVESAALSPGSDEERCASQTAIAISPANLAARVDFYESRLQDEIRPSSILESISVSELARHAAGMELGAACEAATLRFAAKTAAAVSLCPNPDSIGSDHVAAVLSDAVRRASRYTARHERAFSAALAQLRDCTRARQARFDLDLFADEDACLRYLYEWQQQQTWSCPACSSSTRCWLRSRARFECGCGRQYSPRLGTLFVGSHIGLLTWFGVVTALVIEPQISLDHLAARTAVVRRATLGKMASRVRQALTLPDADRQPAGLPQQVIAHLRQVSSYSVSLRRQLGNQCVNDQSVFSSESSENSAQRRQPRRPR
jgi:hypothetical protein